MSAQSQGAVANPTAGAGTVEAVLRGDRLERGNALALKSFEVALIVVVAINATSLSGGDCAAAMSCRAKRSRHQLM